MSVRQILSLKRAAIQTQIDAMTARLTTIDRKLSDLNQQDDGLGLGEAGAGFQLAAMANRTSRTLAQTLTKDRVGIAAQRDTLAREKLALDIADQKLSDAETREARIEASRAADKV